MHNSELISVFKLLDKAQFPRAELFLKSPYHNKDSVCIRLFQYIKPYHSKLDSYRLKREHVEHYLYPDEPSNDLRMRKQMSKLKKLLEQFLIHEQLKTEAGMQTKLLVNASYKKLDHKQFVKLLQKRIKALQKQKIHDADFYQEMLWLQEELYYHPNNRKYNNNNNTFNDLLLSLDQFYTLVKYRFVTDLKVRKEVLNENTQDTPPPITFEQKALDILTDINPLIKLYTLLYAIQERQLSDEDLSAAIDQLKGLLPTTGEKEKSFLLSCFINSIAVQYKTKQKSFSTFMIRLYKLADTQDLILYRGKMQASSFLNIALVSSGGGDFEWAKKFIEKYQIYLSPTERDDTLNLAWGYWNFHYSKKDKQKKKFLQKAHEHLSQIPYSDLSIDLRLRSIQLRVFFEMELLRGDKEFFFDFTNSFERWLRRTEILSEERKGNYLSYVLYARQLGKIFNHTNVDLDRLAKVKAEILKDEAVALQDWLLEKVEELE